LEREGQGKEVLQILLAEECVVIYGEQVLALVDPFFAGAGQDLVPERPGAKCRANAKPQECCGPRLVVGCKAQPGHAEYRLDSHIDIRVPNCNFHSVMLQKETGGRPGVVAARFD
jgi:hypothetical protein